MTTCRDSAVILLLTAKLSGLFEQINISHATLWRGISRSILRATCFLSLWERVYTKKAQVTGGTLLGIPRESVAYN